MLWLSRVYLKNFPELNKKVIYVSSRDVAIITPDFFDELFSRDDFLFVFQEFLGPKFTDSWPSLLRKLKDSNNAS